MTILDGKEIHYMYQVDLMFKVRNIDTAPGVQSD